MAISEKNKPALQTRYGAVNNYLIDADLRQVADQYDLIVRKHKGGSFRLYSVHGSEALEKLTSRLPHAISSEGSIALNRKELKSFFAFLQKPISHALANPSDKKDKAAIHRGHNLLRFLTTGKVGIPRFVDHDLEEAKSLECHEKGERKMKEDDIWALQPEVFNASLNEDTYNQYVSSIPGTTYDPARGFVFDVSSVLMSDDVVGGANQAALRNLLWDQINAVTGSRYSERSAAQIEFTASELEQFLQGSVAAQGVETLIARVQIEGKTQEKIASITSQSQKLRGDVRFQTAVASKGAPHDTQAKFANLNHGISTYLTPTLGQGSIYSSWQRSHFTERLMGLSDPISAVLEDLSVFKMTLDQLSEEGRYSPADLQAVVNEFRPLLSFSVALAEVIQNAPSSQKKRFAKRYGEDALEGLSANMSDLQRAFESASVNGVSAGELSSNYEEIIESLKNTFGQNGNLVTQNAVGYFNTMKSFWTAAAQSSADNPAVFGLLAGLVGYAWYVKYGVDSQILKDSVVSPIAEAASNNGFFDPVGDASDYAPITPDIVADSQAAAEQDIQELIASGEVDECIVRSDCHYNKLLPDPVMNLLDDSVTQYLKFRHWVGEDIIASTAMTGQSLPTSLVDGGLTAMDIKVDENPIFLSVSDTVTSAGGGLAVDVNMFQDGSHATMLGYGASRIATRGPRGFKQMTGLAAEFINPVTRMSVNAGGVAKRGGLKASQLGLTFLGQHDLAAKVHKIQGANLSIRQSVMDNLVGLGAQDGFTLDEDGLQTQEQSADSAERSNIKLWAYGLGQEAVNIGVDNLSALQSSLNDFALLLEYSAKDIGVLKADHKAFLQDTLQKLERAIEDYLCAPDEGNVPALKRALNEHLSHIAGAALLYAGSDGIYNAAFTQSRADHDKRLKGILKRIAAKKEGVFNRLSYRQKMWNEARGLENPYQTSQKLASVQSLKYAWGATKTPFNKAWKRMLGTLSYGADAVVFVARQGIQEPIAQLPHKKKIAKAFASASAIAIPLDMMAGVNGTPIDGIVNIVSGASAALTSVFSSAMVAGAINLPQDIALHTAAVYFSGATLGMAWYYGVKKGVRPGFSAVREALGSGRSQQAYAPHLNYPIVS